jgi:HPt (histidine-containing phosphotransfer) domain-containing protein
VLDHDVERFPLATGRDERQAAEAAMDSSDEKVRDVLDEAKLIDRVGGDRMLLREIVGLFVAEAPDTLKEIRVALRAGDAEQLFVSAHRLRGSVAHFSAPTALDAAMKVEQLARAGDLAAAERACADLEREIDRVRHALRDLIARD